MSSWTGKTVLSVPAGMPVVPGDGFPARVEVAQGVQALAAQPGGTFDLVVVASAGGAVLDAAALTAVAASLKPGGGAEMRELVWLEGVPTAEALGALGAASERVRALRDAEGLRKAALYAGLTPASADVVPLDDPAAARKAAQALYPELAQLEAEAHAGQQEAAGSLDALGAALAPKLGLCLLGCTKPEYKATSFSLRSRKAVETPSAPPVAPPPAFAAAWAAAADGPQEGVALLDEDSLLSEEDRLLKVASQMDCGVGEGGKKKACKNCSCGLKELLENEDGNVVEVPVKSNCGSCGLGDAFRCEGCPHRGKPAFAPGEEVKLAESMMGGEAATATAAAPAAPAKLEGKAGGVVQIGLGDMMDEEF